jgi:ABC-type Fe3+ transport system permease subunit
MVSTYLTPCLTPWILPAVVFTKGAKKTITGDDDSWTDAKAAWVSAIIAAGMFLLTIVVVLPILYKRAKARFDE